MKNEIITDSRDGIEIIEDIERTKYIIDLYMDNKLSNEFEDYWLTNLMNLIPPWRNEKEKRHIALYWKKKSNCWNDSCFLRFIFHDRRFLLYRSNIRLKEISLS